MKIAIFTLPISINYGGILQAYALQTVLENYGHEVFLLNLRYKKNPFWLRFLVYCKRFVYLFLLRKKTWFSKKESDFITKNVSMFVAKYMKLGKATVSDQKLYRECKNRNIDIIVYGSDQIWRPQYAPNILCYFGSFIKKNSEFRQIAYAASFGTKDVVEEFTAEELDTCSNLIKYFSAVSVREVSGVEICRKYFNIEAKCLLDPTLLLTIDNYRQLINNADTKKSNGNLLVYILDENDETKSLINKIAKSQSLRPFYLNKNFNDKTVPIEKLVLPSVEQWLRGFDEADYVLTDSFHGCVFSILFKKQFVSLGNKVRGMERFESLLGIFGLCDRLVDVKEYDEIVSLLFNKKIQYEDVYAILEKERSKAYSFLREYIC